MQQTYSNSDKDTWSNIVRKGKVSQIACFIGV